MRVKQKKKNVHLNLVLATHRMLASYMIMVVMRRKVMV